MVLQVEYTSLSIRVKIVIWRHILSLSMFCNIYRRLCCIWTVSREFLHEHCLAKYYSTNFYSSWISAVTLLSFVISTDMVM